MLPEDILLDIFDFYRLDAIKLPRGRPWKWHRLAHVCRKWRYVISISPRRLDLRILCKYGAPIESIMGAWPALPLVIEFDATRKSKPMPRNILVALRSSDRICDINFSVTGSMIGSIVELIQKPFPALEKIRLTVKDAICISVYDAFLGGSTPHLREIELHGIALPFPAIRQVLLSTNNLSDLHLSNIPSDICFLPVDLVTALSTLDQLKRLTISFHSPTSYPAPSMTHRSLRHTILPSLKFLDFHGTSEYLEEFVAQIHLPALCKITINLFNQIFFEIPQFSQFIPHQNSNVLGSPTLVLVTHSAESVNVFLIQKENSSPDEYCYLGTSCRRLDNQLSFVTQILSQLSPLLSSVAKLTFITHLEMPTGKEDVDPTQWLGLFQLFTHVREIHVFEQLVPNIVQALVTEAMDIGVLPELTSLSLNGYRKSPSAAKAAEEFVATRRASGRTVSLSG
jgi:F-box-like